MPKYRLVAKHSGVYKHRLLKPYAPVVRGIDDELRTRQTSALLRHGPSPLMPGSWAEAVSAAVQLARGIAADVRERWVGPSGETLPGRLPEVALYLALALGLLVFARGWVEALPRRMSERASDYAWSSAAPHCGLRPDPVLASDLPLLDLVPDWRAWLEPRDDEQVVQRVRFFTARGWPMR